MSKAYLHLVINHFPIIFSLVAAIAALLALAIRRKGVLVYAAASLTIAGLTVQPTVMTGEWAEEVAEDQWYASRDAIHEHEEAGERARWVVLAAGLMGAYSWWRLTRRGEVPSPLWLRAGLLVASLLAAAATAKVGWESGFITHKNTRLGEGGSASPAVPQPPERGNGVAPAQ